MKFLRSTKTHNVYDFVCSRCGAAGEIGLPKRSTKLIEHECGDLFIQRPARGMFGKPELIEVNIGK